MLSRNSIQLRVKDFITQVILNVAVVSFVAAIIPVILKLFLKDNLWSFLLASSACIISTIVSIYYIGFNNKERAKAIAVVLKFKEKYIK